MKTTVFKAVFLSMGLILISCGGQKTTTRTKDQAQLEKMVHGKSLRLEARWANPLATQSINAIANAGLLPPGSNANRIDIMGTASFLKIKNDSVMAILPYYGERQFGSTYNPLETGIQFQGIPENFEITYNEKKEHYTFQFDITGARGEGFNVNGTLFPNLRTTFYINSTERLTIGYSGYVEALPDETSL